MGLLDFLSKKDTNLTYYANNVLKIVGNYFGNDSGSVTMAKLIKAYGENPIVFSIVNFISGICDNSDKQLLSGENEIEDGEVYEILNSLNEMGLYTNLLSSGNAFLRFNRGIGMGAEFEVLNSKDVEIVLTAAGFVKEYNYCIGNRTLVIPEEEILHIKFDNIVKTDENNMHYGYSPLEAAMKIVTASSEIFNAEASIFKNRGIVGLLSSGNDMPIFGEDVEKMQEAFQDRAAGSDNFNKVLVTSSNAKYVQMGMSPQDLQLIDNQLSKLRYLCAVFGIDSKLLGDGANSTYNNVREAQKNMYVNTILPLLKRVNHQLIKFLNKEYGTNYEYKTNLSKVEALKQEHTLDQLILEKISERDMSLEELLVIQNPQSVTMGVESVEVESGEDTLEEVPEAANENALAQASLRGSVGGVQGILAIQTAIQQGTASESAAIATLIEIYGFDEQTARRILGI